MRHARWLKPNPDGEPNPELAIYHVVSRVVDRRFVLGAEEKVQFRMLMRLYERFSGCRFFVLFHDESFPSSPGSSFGSCGEGRIDGAF